MKSRKVVLTLEVKTDAPLSTLKRIGAYEISVLDEDAPPSRRKNGGVYDIEVLQAQANVVRNK